jgi:RNA polymerase sigma-70 factor (ECF subfamily)
MLMSTLGLSGRDAMGRFPTTRWSVFLAGQQDPSAARAALQHLCSAYRAPVLAYVRRRVGAGADADDLTQSFFTALIERRVQDQADPQRGRFRSLLLTALDRYLINAAAFAHAERRGGGMVHQDIDAAGSDVPADGDPEQVFVRQWALTVLSRAISALEQEARTAGKAELFDALRDYLIESPDDDAYARLAARFDMRSNTLAVAVHRLRQRLRACVRSELSDTVSTEQELDEEMNTLRLVLGGNRNRGARAARTPAL